MKFTASTNWNIASKAAYRAVRWTVEFKKTTDITEALSTGTWIDITSYINLDSIFPISQRIEYDPGQFTSDSITITARDIDWLRANMFNATSSQYIEIRIKGSIGVGSSAMSSDTFYAFSGFADKNELENEREDSNEFTVYTAEELGNRIELREANIQYLNYDIDGAGAEGVFLPLLPGVWVTDAAVASYNLNVGIHTINQIFDWFNNKNYYNLDDGANVSEPLTAGSITLVNKEGDQKITLYVNSLANQKQNAQDYIIVTTKGNTLPKQHYSSVSIQTYLKKLYAKIGITTTTFDTLTLNSHDGGKRISYIDLPPNDDSTAGKRYAMETDGTDIYLGVGANLYKKTLSTGDYTLVWTITSGAGEIAIKKLMYNSRNDHLWIFYTNATNGDCVRRYNISTDNMSSEVVINATADTYNPYNVSLIDYNYTGSSYKYGILFGDVGTSDVKFLTSATLTISTAITLTRTITQYQSDYNFTKTVAGVDYYYFGTSTGATNYIEIFHVDGTGTFTSDGDAAASGYPDKACVAYHPTDDRIYYISTAGISSHTIGSATVTNITNGNILPAVITNTYAIKYDAGTGKIYGVIAEQDQFPNAEVYEVSNNAVDNYNACTMVKFTAISYVNSRLYGIDISGRLFQWHTVINMFINPAIPEGTILERINKTLNAFLLIGIISSHKKAFVYRRANDSGTKQTTGNAITIDESKVVNITRQANAFTGYDIVVVSNGVKTVSYNGTNFNEDIFTGKRLEVTNELYADNILEDIAYYFYQFWNNAHDTYSIELNTAEMQYEVMDEATLSLSARHMAIADSGLIIGTQINIDGSLSVDVLL